MASPELHRVMRCEWSSIHAFIDAVREHTGLLPETMGNPPLMAAVFRSKFVERHSRDNDLVRVTSQDFWEDLVGIEVIMHDSIKRMGG